MSSHSKHLTLKQDTELKGLVIVVSKKVAKLATERNKLRRRIKEIIRLELKTNKETTRQDLVVGTLYTRKGITELDFSELKKEVVSLLK